MCPALRIAVGMTGGRQSTLRKAEPLQVHDQMAGNIHMTRLAGASLIMEPKPLLTSLLSIDHKSFMGSHLGRPPKMNAFIASNFNSHQ